MKSSFIVSIQFKSIDYFPHRLMLLWCWCYAAVMPLLIMKWYFCDVATDDEMQLLFNCQFFFQQQYLYRLCYNLSRRIMLLLQSSSSIHWMLLFDGLDGTQYIVMVTLVLLPSINLTLQLSKLRFITRWWYYSCFYIQVIEWWWWWYYSVLVRSIQ